ncbi:glycosyltransferase [Winogradskyella costae]|uniref:glycosyltransferase n=1 Tax=Winogradskyella costae TaxID=2697008 RepID=UPI0015CD629D|nr:glycosyltransferase [Winogradskyella costae]
MKIIFIIPSLVPGGAERVVSFVSQNIDNIKFDPLLLVIGFPEDTAYDVSNVNVKYLKKSRVLTAIPIIISEFLKHNPSIVFSSISHTNMAMSLIAPYFRKIKFIGREATILSKRTKEPRTRKWSPINLLSLNFNNLDMIICQSTEMAQDMIKNYNIIKEKTCIINNPISELPPLKTFNSALSIKKFITVGRLVEVKGYFRILETLSKLDFPFLYTIIGDGNLKEEIFNKAKELSINKYINHIPFTTNVNEYIINHDYFLQGSYVEGFPNALLESCVAGTPVIAFEAPGGTKEIIINGVNGYLVANEHEFLERLQDEKSWNPIEIRASVYKKFNKEKIIKQYETLFFEILKENEKY